MKKFILYLVLPLGLGSAVLLPGCKEKTQDKAAATTTQTKASADSAAAATPQVNTDTAATTPAPKSGQKFGYINSAELLKLMPEAKKAEASLTTYVRNLEKQFGTLQRDYQQRITEFQSQENTMVDAVKQSRIKAITDLEQRMQQSQVSAQQQIAAKREALFKPILDKAEKSIKEVGKENNYDYIFDTSSGSFIYADESHNVLPLVKAKLGIK
ncbi:MAG: OmpH family outer membrane protein [Adhaeribacter sp.]